MCPWSPRILGSRNQLALDLMGAEAEAAGGLEAISCANNFHSVTQMGQDLENDGDRAGEGCPVKEEPSEEEKD